MVAHADRKRTPHALPANEFRRDEHTQKEAGSTTQRLLFIVFASGLSSG